MYGPAAIGYTCKNNMHLIE